MDSTLALGAFRIAKGRGRRSGGRQFSVQSDNRFSGRGGGVGSPPRAWRRVRVPGAAGAKKKSVRLASVFPSPPFRSSDFAGPRRPRLYGFHTHSEPFESQETRAAKRYVNGSLVERGKGD